MKRWIYCLGVMFLGLTTDVLAEYRAYELEVFDHIEQTRQIITTTFSPSDYILSRGGPQRISVVLRASWMCWGDTSQYRRICPSPPPISPRFQIGESVQIVLEKHISHKWIGVVENSFYRPDLRSNVYGVRFPERKDMYTRYYEGNLQLAPETAN